MHSFINYENYSFRHKNELNTTIKCTTDPVAFQAPSKEYEIGLTHKIMYLNHFQNRVISLSDHFALRSVSNPLDQGGQASRRSCNRSTRRCVY